ncbi:MAG: peptide transporter, partial [Euryarchaeota archaeon]|nr:peptide transporter [Euryarchaeota archaeon]
MLKKEILTMLAIVLVIFLIGFVFRVGSASLYGIPDNEKPFYKDNNGIPYMYELDSYYNYRLTRNYLDHGYLGDAKVNGKEWDLHSYYPGVPMDYPPLIVYITAFFYKFINIFVEVPLFAVCFWLPAFIGPLCGIPAYLFVRRFTNDYGGIVAGILAVTSVIYFIRTVPGWFDTDMFIILFPLLIVWFFIEAVYAKEDKKRIFFAILSGFSMFLFSMAWNGWQYLFYVIVVFSLSYLIWYKIRGEDTKNLFYVFITFLIGTFMFIIVFLGLSYILKLFLGLFEFMKVGSGQNIWAPWPDIYTSVSELGRPSLREVISTGGATFGLGIFGILVLFVLLKKKTVYLSSMKNVDWFFFTLLLLWISIGLVSLLKGARFMMMLIPPLVIAAGIMVGVATEGLKFSKRGKRYVKILSIFAILVFTIPPIVNTNEALYVLSPGANDDLWDSALWIHNNTQNDTVVVLAEWSYGHFFTAIADRPVLLDGRLAYIET